LLSAAVVICAYIAAIIWTGWPKSRSQLLREESLRRKDEIVLDVLSGRHGQSRGEAASLVAPVSPILFAGFTTAKDTPRDNHTAIRIIVRNQSDANLTGLVARLVSAEPTLGSINNDAINLPLVLETKGRLDRLRNPQIAEQIPRQGFNLHAHSEKPIEVVWLHSTGALEGYITHEAGEASFLFVESLDLRVEVTCAGQAIAAVVRINIDYENSQMWTVELIVEAAGEAHGQGGFGRRA
jgi:hypothetical protein